ncbi:hypothetical protein NEOLEDRAFT_1035431, partial [Neolentinus lepideus HHB14362 ss-1]
AAQDDLMQSADGRSLCNVNSSEMARFFWEETVCQCGHISQIMADNGSEIKAAFAKL